jgi:hypothetical protein
MTLGFLCSPKLSSSSEVSDDRGLAAQYLILGLQVQRLGSSQSEDIVFLLGGELGLTH